MAARSAGLTTTDMLEMSFSEVILFLQSRARASESESDDGRKRATDAQVMAWAGR